MKSVQSVIYSQVGENRGVLRIWVEGQKLAATGVKPGDRYSVVPDQQVIRMVFSAEGDHVVARRNRNGRELPIIDVTGAKLALFKANDRVRVVVKDGQIEVTLHHQERARQNREARITRALATGQPILIGSMAHGGGILDHAIHEGLAEAGVSAKLAFANELEPEYLEASLSNNPVWADGSIAIQGPMQDVEWSLLPKVDVLVAGLPCTGASSAGKAKNGNKHAEEHEGAGALFYAFLSAIQATRPSLVILENVENYLTTTSMTVIRSVLSHLDYRVQETVLSGEEFGVLENRRRMCMVASSKGLSMPDIGLIERPLFMPKLLGDVMEDVPPDDESWRSYSYLADKEVRDKAAGKGFRRQLVNRHSTSVGCSGAGYAKARSTEPFIEHPSGDGRSRLMTPVEHARVKSIPEYLVSGCSNTTAHEILGQSVLHTVFKAVGLWIGKGLLANVSTGRFAVAA
ncbi:DNA cytosine methyltransferase [Nevskia ramosa]|uniref:DNA cytosine methyltransferase n=1 Tax=Nevskia ramosa TaxID=64002 RepID=UPI002356BEC6|nr:DNA cytosine methyltransferase [Nevskia ramosa]